MKLFQTRPIYIQRLQAILETMITFSSFPAPSYDNYASGATHPPGADEDHEFDFDLDDEDFGASGRKLTLPGEALTSSQAFMR